MTKYDWIYGVWFVCDPTGGDEGHGVDWLAQLFKADGQWVCEYRFRYYADENSNPFDGGDRKSWFTAKMKGDTLAERDKAIAAINMLVPLMELRFRHKVDFVLLDCAPGDPKMFFELGSRPWAHLKKEPPDAK